jgi:hypothetical protein
MTVAIFNGGIGDLVGIAVAGDDGASVKHWGFG